MFFMMSAITRSYHEPSNVKISPGRSHLSYAKISLYKPLP